jgi:hypothetical protein
VCSECRLWPQRVATHSLQVAMLLTDIPGVCVLWQSPTRRKVCLWQTRRVSKFQRQSIQAWLAAHALAQVVSHLDRITLFFSRCPAQLPQCLAADQCTFAHIFDPHTRTTLALHCIASQRTAKHNRNTAHGQDGGRGDPIHRLSRGLQRLHGLTCCPAGELIPHHQHEHSPTYLHTAPTHACLLSHPPTLTPN